MTRLTNDIRDRIIRRLIEHRFSEHEKELEKHQHAFGLAVYEDLYSPEIQTAMAALPIGFFLLREYVDCQFGHDYETIYFGCSKPIAAVHHICAAKIYETTAPIAKQFFKLKEEKDELRNKKDVARETARSILYSVHTVEKLLQTWPECKPFVEVSNRPEPLLPALPIAEVNTMFGLSLTTQDQANWEAAA